MDIWFVLSAVGSIASLVGLLLPAQGWRQRALHVVYGMAILALTSSAFWYWKQNNRIHDVERAATTLIQDVEGDYTQIGFIQAALAFLEKNKDLYPDAYRRAQKQSEDCQCLQVSDSKTVELSYALRGLLKGISTLEGGK